MQSICPRGILAGKMSSTDYIHYVLMQVACIIWEVTYIRYKHYMHIIKYAICLHLAGVSETTNSTLSWSDLHIGRPLHSMGLDKSKLGCGFFYALAFALSMWLHYFNKSNQY